MAENVGAAAVVVVVVGATVVVFGAGAVTSAGVSGVVPAGPAETYSVSDVASPEPAVFVAVTRHATVRPRSASVSVYVAAVSPATTRPLRSHSNVTLAGLLLKPPLMQVSVWPTTGGRSSVGSPDGGGRLDQRADRRRR